MSKSIQEVIVPDGILFGKIYSLRHENIMLDRDLADLYGVKPFRLLARASSLVGYII
ncbi:MAG: ORF6N domain-containing protein [Sphingobacterium sp.]|nr:ORF6N domain-containing protein [Sphingobacterium sp.]